jgi:hypothetical protein
VLPLLAFANEQAHDDGERDRREAAEEHDSPRVFRRIGEPHAGDLVVDEAREDDAER